MWQANYIHDALMTSHAGLQVRMEVIKTQGDQLLHGPLHKLGDKGLFTKEIEQALVEGKIDLAVHSLKDLPTRTADGLTLGAITAREDPADALVARHGWTLETLPPGAGIFTSSLRRQAQVLHLRADLHVWPVRGNVPTRLRKFDKSESQGILFARAGLVRLGLGERITQRLDPGDFLPACGQGALAVEVRCDDERTRQLVAELDDATSRCACTAERAFLGRLHGGCQVPVGAFARFAPGTTELTVSGMVANLDGSRMLRRTTSGPCTQAPQAEEIGLRLAELLLADGCQGILDEVLRQSPPAPEVEA
jgi:hydroxymethylbilane synthase